VSDIVKGVLGGAWSLLVGWFLPTALNLVVFGFLVVPRLDESAPRRWFDAAGPQSRGLALLVAAVLLGLLLAAVQTPLYRVLEGYVGWRPGHPLGAILERSRERQVRRKQVLLGRLDLVELSALEKADQLREELRPRLAEVRADARLAPYAARDAKATASQLGLLREKVRRYPVDDAQVVPTRLGNAIRRLEEYGYQRFRLDSQTLWYELCALAPDQARKQVDQARTTIDFLVCLLYGNLLVAAFAAVAAGAGLGQRLPLLLVAAGLVALAFWWYRIAVTSTDDWAAATRALVNIGRRPLATGLGLDMPPRLEQERAMWATVSRLSARPYDSKSADGDAYRRPPDPPTAGQCPGRGA
jgi:hypothetical protein